MWQPWLTGYGLAATCKDALREYPQRGVIVVDGFVPNPLAGGY